MENSGISLVITDIWMNDNEKEGFELLEWCKAFNALNSSFNYVWPWYY